MKTQIAIALIIAVLALPQAAHASTLTYSGPEYFEITHDCKEFSVGYCPNKTFDGFNITYIPSADIQPGGKVRIYHGYVLPSGTEISYFFAYKLVPFQVKNPSKANYVSVSAPVPTNQQIHFDGIEITFPQGITAGSPVTVVAGDTSQGSPGMRISNFDISVDMLVSEDVNATGNFTLLPPPYLTLKSAATRLDYFKVTAPSTPEESFTITVSAMEGVENSFVNNSLVDKRYTGTVAFYSDTAAVLPPPYTFRRSDKGTKDFTVAFKTPGVHTVTVADSKANRTGTSNPILIKTGRRKIYWGVLHHHNAIGGHSTGRPSDAWEYGKHVSKLDFLAVTDHCKSGMYDWAYLSTLPNKYYEPGKFVSFLGYEWSNAFNGGHRHVIFKNPENQTVLCETGNGMGQPNFQIAPTIQTLYSALASKNAIALIHHTLWNAQLKTNWGNPNDPNVTKVQRLVEMYSWHGSSEEYGGAYPIHGSAKNQYPPGSKNSVQDIIASGHKVGITAGDDNHLARPGSQQAFSTSPANIRYSQGGLTAVLADNLTREGVWDALYNRRTYGTTGARIILDVKVNGREMGSEFTTARKPTIVVHAIGTSPIVNIFVLRDGKNTAFLYNGTSRQESFEWTDSSFTPGQQASYYVRVEQEDGQQAWSSPIWVTMPTAKPSLADWLRPFLRSVAHAVLA